MASYDLARHIWQALRSGSHGPGGVTQGVAASRDPGEVAGVGAQVEALHGRERRARVGQSAGGTGGAR